MTDGVVQYQVGINTHFLTVLQYFQFPRCVLYDCTTHNHWQGLGVLCERKIGWETKKKKKKKTVISVMNNKDDIERRSAHSRWIR